MMKLLSVIGLFLVAMVVVLAAFLFRSSKAAFSDADLRITRTPVADENNACYYLAEAARLVVLSEEDQKTLPAVLSKGGWNPATASELLTNNAEALRVLQKA